MIASRILRVVIADKEGCFVLMPDGIYGKKTSEATKKLLTGNLLKLAVICVAYQKAIVIMIASLGLRIVIADKVVWFVVMPVASMVKKRVKPLKKMLRGKLFKLAFICVAFQKTIVIMIASRGLRVVIADKEGCFVLMPEASVVKKRVKPLKDG